MICPIAACWAARVNLNLFLGVLLSHQARTAHQYGGVGAQVLPHAYMQPGDVCLCGYAVGGESEVDLRNLWHTYDDITRAWWPELVFPPVSFFLSFFGLIYYIDLFLFLLSGIPGNI